MTAEEYVKQELLAGRLTAAHIVELVRHFQVEHDSLKADGMPGPATRGLLEREYMQRNHPAPLVISWPLPVLKDGRKPLITSGFHTVNPSRPDHNGVDLFYEWRPGDKPDHVGDRGAAGWVTVNGVRQPKYVVPYSTEAIAAAAGVVQIAGKIGTGYRVWIDHGNGWRTGYFHLDELFVSPGDVVKVGRGLGWVGDSPRGDDGRHLHFEVSPVDRYAPVDPAPYLK